ncbi:MAG: type VI secretion system tip protein VgrG, partial [Thiothrix litoralis]
MEITQAEREIAIKTQLGADTLVLRSVVVREELARLPSMQAELLSLKEDIPFEDLLGTNATISLKLSDGTRFFNGYITSIAQTGNQGSFAVYEAIIHPWLWFLTRTTDCRIFQNQTVPDIIKAVFRDLGYTDFKEKLSNTYSVWDYCVQYRETDFNFISRLLEQEGIYYYFTQEDGRHELILADGYSSHQPITAPSSIPFYPPDEAVVRKEASCTHWHVAKQVLPGKYMLNDFDFKRPRASLRSSHAIPRSHAIADYEVYDYPGEYTQIDAGNSYARTRIEELHTGYEQASGQSDVRTLLAGGLFTLAEHPRDDQNREYLLTAVTHTLHSDVFEGQTTTSGQHLYSNHFTGIDSKTPFRPARITPKPHIRGPQTAIVVGPAGEEIYTDEHGRVKLQFHWDRYGKSDENSSCWVRVSQVWAGKNWGAMHIPRIGQEVIVEFLEGDPDHPIITGRVYNGEQIPPYGLPANKTQSGIKSRSSQGGSGANFNEIRMEDKKGAEQLYIHAEKNQD